MIQKNHNNLHGENGASFEQAFARLQEVVQKLSEGSLTLQEALSAFEEGMELADRCTQMLDHAELRIRQINARAARTPADALADLDQAMSLSPVMEADDEPLSIEIESIETRVRFDAPSAGNLAYGKLPGEGRGGARSGPDVGGGGAQKARGTAPAGPPADDLDPLFDEDD